MVELLRDFFENHAQPTILKLNVKVCFPGCLNVMSGNMHDPIHKKKRFHSVLFSKFSPRSAYMLWLLCSSPGLILDSASRSDYIRTQRTKAYLPTNVSFISIHHFFKYKILITDQL